MAAIINPIWNGGPQAKGALGVRKDPATVKMKSRWTEYIQELIHDFAKYTDFQTTKIGGTAGIHSASQLNTVTIETSAQITPAMKLEYYSDDDQFFEAIFVAQGFSYDAEIVNKAKTRLLTELINKKMYMVKCGPFKPGPLLELSMPANKLGLLQERKVEIMTIHKETGQRLLSLFDSRPVQGNVGTERQAERPPANEHVFLVFDTGNKLLRDVKMNAAAFAPAPGGSFTMHNIHSLSTYSDSASKPVAGANVKYAYTVPIPGPGNRKLKSLDWFCDHAKMRVIGPKDAVFLSQYEITLSASAPNVHSQSVVQKWKLGTDQVKTIADSHKDNTKTKVIAEINGGLTKKDVKYAAERKRSGDYGQVRALKLFPELAVLPVGQGVFRYVATGTQAGTAELWPTRNGGLETKKKWFRDRAYFVTGDKPAAGASIMAGNNTILYNTSSGVITRWKF